MADAPKVLEEKLETILTAWRQLRPEKAFNGMSLAQFEEITQPSRDCRARMCDLEMQLRGLIATRATSDEAAWQAISRLANSVKGDPSEGEDSDFFGALGYVRKGERKRGLTRKPNEAAFDPGL